MKVIEHSPLKKIEFKVVWSQQERSLTAVELNPYDQTREVSRGRKDSLG